MDIFKIKPKDWSELKWSEFEYPEEEGSDSFNEKLLAYINIRANKIKNEHLPDKNT